MRGRRWRDGGWARACSTSRLAHVAQFQSPRSWANSSHRARGCLDAAGAWREAEALYREACRPAPPHVSRFGGNRTGYGGRTARHTRMRACARPPSAPERASATRRFATPDSRSLRWLNALQVERVTCSIRWAPTVLDGRTTAPARFDQQPIEAAATVDACIAAAEKSTAIRCWVAPRRRRWIGFIGENDLGLPLADPAKACCRDGLHPDRVNANAGAESTLCYLLACCSPSAAEKERSRRRDR